MTGFRAFEDRNLAEAVEQFRAALTIAYEEKAPIEELGAILENLATAYLAAGQPESAWEAIERWDNILAKSADEPWKPEQQAIRDDLAPVILQALGETGPTRDPEIDTVESAVPPVSGGYAIHLESTKIADNIQPSWERLKAAYPSILADKSLVVKQVDLGDKGVFNRLLATPFASSAEARNVCKQLSELGQYCAVNSLE